ncbi:helix-turn-helix domain-containing protein [Rhodococcus spelaei]|uniref:Helix-turn-helix domain-containing protein n=1 Tax=Rhodococcus spelaei TaxID=2546320 RepID=A0A541BRL0_9NOCA|nr:helix-turn-helix domain-containing protein [Rhodococcus spelaei]TQF74926.1 helix-turn-helix domain-containing protein [Rhodococcus spelaei]
MTGRSLPQASSLTQRFHGGVRVSGPEGLELLSVAAEMVASRPERFRAEMSSADFGSIRVNRLRSSAVSVIRTSSMLADEHSAYLSMVYVRSGEVRVEQNRAGARASAGEVTFADFAAPFEVGLSRRGDYVFIYLPHVLLTSRSVDSRALVGATVAASPLCEALAVVLTQFVASDLCKPGAAETTLIEHAIVDLCLAVIRQATDRSPVHDETGTQNRARAREFVDSHFTDPALTIADVAASINVSPRYLQKLFEAEEHSVYDLIRRRRVQWGVELLTDPAHAALTVSQVAVRCGFVGLSQFSRAVRDLTGSSPRTIRRQPVVRGQGSA